LDDFLHNKFSKKIKDLTCLEIGCSVGGMTRSFAKKFKKIVAIDIDKGAIERAKKFNALSNIKYQIADALNLPFKNDSFDVVICNHIYEHVPDAFKMMDEIRRVLKKNGVCYLAGPNKYTLIENHYFLPFLSWLPKSAAGFYLKIMGKGSNYYETPFSYKELKKLVAGFKIYDYTAKVLKKPKKFQATYKFQKIISAFPIFLLKIFRPFMPSFFWVLLRQEGNNK